MIILITPQQINIIKSNILVSQDIPLKDSVYEALRKTIIIGEIPAGERINEKELAEKLNISRTPVRYALLELEKEKLVEHIPRVGRIVKGITIKDAFEIYDIRKALDTLATVKAYEQMTDDDFEELRQLLLTGEKYNDANEIDLVLQNFSDFNNFIWKKSKMVRLKSIVTKLSEYLLYFRDLSIRSSDRRDLALREHWLIYRGMKNRDKDQIEMIIGEHLENSKQFILNEMKRRNIN